MPERALIIHGHLGSPEETWLPCLVAHMPHPDRGEIQLLAQKPWMVPIPGTTALYRLDENLGAGKLELAKEGLSQIAKGLAEIEITGE